MSNRHRFFVAVFVIMSMLLLPGILFADVTGSVFGVVHDRAKAVVKVHR